MQYEQSAIANVSEPEKTFRTIIGNDAALSYFLEKGSMRKNIKFYRDEIYKDPAFLAFISPYFQDVYVKVILRAFDLKDTNLMSDVAANPILMNDAHKKQAFDQIRTYLEEMRMKLASLNNKLQLGSAIRITELSAYTGIITIANLNYLPFEFHDLRSAYSKEIFKTIRWLVSKDFSSALNMATDLRELKCDAQTKYDNDALYRILENASQKTAAAKRVYHERQINRSNILAIIGFIAFVIELIMMLAR